MCPSSIYSGSDTDGTSMNEVIKFYTPFYCAVTLSFILYKAMA